MSYFYKHIVIVHIWCVWSDILAHLDCVMVM